MKIKTYVITVSEYFPQYHSKKGQPTLFVEHIDQLIKIHTIRNNYELWRKRFVNIQAGLARLSIRVWTGKPYASKQREVKSLTKEDGIGIQHLKILANGYELDGNFIDEPIERFAEKDGLSDANFTEWFKHPNQTMAIIHFTKFRY